VAGFLLAQHQHGTAPWQEGVDSPLAELLPRPDPAPETEAPAASDEPRMPTFEFYTLLPESEVVAPRSEMPASTARPPAPLEESTPDAGPVDDPIARVIAANLQRNQAAQSTPESDTGAREPQSTASDESRYMLQAASFREAGDAEQLSQRLRNLSLVSQISQVRSSAGETWHRVQVGPYADSRELSRAQDLMITQGIEPLLIRLQN
jgi:cell division protein FtsN